MKQPISLDVVISLVTTSIYHDYAVMSSVTTNFKKYSSVEFEGKEKTISNFPAGNVNVNPVIRNALKALYICEAAGVSVQRLTRMFQSQFNMAVAEYMNACRIKLAKELLPDRQLTVAQIAQQVGYSNADTFTRNFRKVEGITASEYRKMLPEC